MRERESRTESDRGGQRQREGERDRDAERERGSLGSDGDIEPRKERERAS